MFKHKDSHPKSRQDNGRAPLHQPFHYRHTGEDEIATLKADLNGFDTNPTSALGGLAIYHDSTEPIPVSSHGIGHELHREPADIMAEANSEDAWARQKAQQH